MIGIRSRVQLAQKSGIATNKGIVVNRLLETSVKTPACPLTVLPVPAGVQGEWVVKQQHNDTRALFYDKGKVLRGFALTGSCNSEVTGLAKQIPALME